MTTQSLIKIELFGVPENMIPFCAINGISVEATNAGEPIPNLEIAVTLPNGMRYYDGSFGTKTFTTSSDGSVSIPSLRLDMPPGYHPLTASALDQTATTTIKVTDKWRIHPIQMPVRSGPRNILFKKDGSLGYVTTDTGIMTLANSVPGAIGKLDSVAEAFVLSQDERTIYTCGYGSEAIAFDTTTMMQKKKFQIDDVLMNAVGTNGRVVCVSETYAHVYVLDPDTMELMHDIPGAGTGSFVFDDQNNVVYVGGSEIAIINTNNWQVERHIPVEGQLIRQSRDGKIIYCTGTSFSAFDKATEETLFSVPLGFEAWDVALSVDGLTAYIVSPRERYLTAISTQNGVVQEKIPIGSSIFGVGIDNEGNVYCCSSIFGYILVITV